MSTENPEPVAALRGQSLANYRLGGYVTVCGRIEALAPETDAGVLIGTIADRSGKLNLIVPPAIETPALEKGGWYEITDLQTDIGPGKLVLVATDETTVREKRPDDYFEYPPLGQTEWLAGGLFWEWFRDNSYLTGEAHRVLTILRPPSDEIEEDDPDSDTLTIAHGSIDRYLEVHDHLYGAAEPIVGWYTGPRAEVLGQEPLPYAMSEGEATEWVATHGHEIDGFDAETLAELATITDDLREWLDNRPTMADYQARGERCPAVITADGQTLNLSVAQFMDSLSGKGQFVELAPRLEQQLLAVCATLGGQTTLRSFID